MIMQITKEQLFDIFSWGIDYGQLTMEEEREQEELADAFQGVIIDAKYSMPSQPVLRRQVHTEKWFNAKRKSITKFLDFMAENCGSI